MKYLARCKKTLYYDWTSHKFGDNRKVISSTLKCEDLFNTLVTLVSKKEQIAIIEDTADNKLKLNVLSGDSYNINSSIAKQYFDLIYTDDICFETKQKLLKKIK